MSLVKIKEKYQVTIPSAIRDKLSLKVGDMLEADLENDQIVLKPKMIVDKSEAWRKLLDIMESVHSKNKQFDPDEVEQDVLMAVHESRRKKA